MPPAITMADLLEFKLAKNEIKKRQIQAEVNKLAIQKKHIEMSKKYLTEKTKKQQIDPVEQKLKEEIKKKTE